VSILKYIHATVFAFFFVTNNYFEKEKKTRRNISEYKKNFLYMCLHKNMGNSSEHRTRSLAISSLVTPVPTLFNLSISIHVVTLNLQELTTCKTTHKLSVHVF